MPFEVFDKRMTPLAKAPSVTIQKRGVISLNKAAHDLIDNAETVELLYDCDRHVVALRAADDSAPHAYAVRRGSKRGPGQAMVSATAFTAHYGIDTAETRRWRPFVEDGMICVDLSQEGTVITGNRTKTAAPADAEEVMDSSEDVAPSDVPTGDAPDHSWCRAGPSPAGAMKRAPPMAHNVAVRLVDDLDDGPADDTVTFALDGRAYEVCLSAANAEKLREALRPYAAAGRRATGPRPGAADGTSPWDSRIDPETARIRAWTKDNGHRVAGRGRVHRHFREAYCAAHRSPA